MKVDGATVFLASRRRYMAALRFLRAIFDGFWLGMLSDRSLEQINERYYDDELTYVDDSYTLSGFQAWERDAVDSYFADARRVAVTSAGGGREVLALLSAGHEAVGYEPQANLVQYGSRLLEREGHRGALVHCPPDVWPDAADGFDAAIVGWGGYMLIPGRSRRVEFLRAARAHLPDGAPILLSFFTRYQSRGQVKTSHRIANALRWLRRAEPSDPGDVLEPNRLHSFTQDEVSRELEAAGFEMIDYGTADYGWAVGRAMENGNHIRP